MSRLQLVIVTCAIAILGGCTLDKQSAPALSGPSGFGRALTITATPDSLVRDGSSQSIIKLNYRDGSTNEPLSQQRLIVTASAGSLSVAEVTTDQGGNATLAFTAPSLNTPVTTVSIAVTSVGNDAANSVSNRVLIGVVGPDFPNPSFEFTPATPLQFQRVTFNASGTTLSGSACSQCDYLWDFGDGNTESDDAVIDHAYQSQGSFLVRLTVVSPGGTSNAVTRTVTVGTPAAPVASFSFSPSNPKIGDTVFFNAAASKGANGATIEEYRWNFGNASAPQVTTTPTTSTTYTSDRSFTVELTVVDSNGQTGTTSQSVSVVP
jgi:PKD repeat protein